MADKHQTHIFNCSKCNRTIPTCFNAHPLVRGYEILAGCPHHHKSDTILNLLPSELASLVRTTVLYTDRPSVGARVIMSTGKHGLVSGYPVKAKHWDKVFVQKDGETGCNSVALVKFCNLKPEPSGPTTSTTLKDANP